MRIMIMYVFSPWVNTDAYDILILFSGLQLLLTLLILFYFLKKNKKSELALTLLFAFPSASVFLVINFYWYIYLLFLLTTYIATYYEIRDNNQLRKSWQKNILFSVGLSIFIPSVVIIAFNCLGFGYKLFAE